MESYKAEAKTEARSGIGKEWYSREQDGIVITLSLVEEWQVGAPYGE